MSDPISMRKASRKAIAIMDLIETQRRESVQAETVSEPTTEGRWTNEPPTVPGWYWWRYKVYTPTGDVEEKAICVREECTMTYFAVAGEWWSTPIQEPPR